jgi:hypothetical protein
MTLNCGYEPKGRNGMRITMEFDSFIVHEEKIDQLVIKNEIYDIEGEGL